MRLPDSELSIQASGHLLNFLQASLAADPGFLAELDSQEPQVAAAVRVMFEARIRDTDADIKQYPEFASSRNKLVGWMEKALEE